MFIKNNVTPTILIVAKSAIRVLKSVLTILEVENDYLRTKIRLYLEVIQVSILQLPVQISLYHKKELRHREIKNKNFRLKNDIGLVI